MRRYDLLSNARIRFRSTNSQRTENITTNSNGGSPPHLSRTCPPHPLPCRAPESFRLRPGAPPETQRIRKFNNSTRLKEGTYQRAAISKASCRLTRQHGPSTFPGARCSMTNRAAANVSHAGLISCPHMSTDNSCASAGSVTEQPGPSAADYGPGHDRHRARRLRERAAAPLSRRSRRGEITVSETGGANRCVCAFFCVCALCVFV